MKTKIFNKLVRDKIPEIIKANGAIPQTKILEKSEYKKELFKKLHEECKEVISSENTQSLTEELADVLEVLKAIAKNNNIHFEKIEKIRIHKKETSGGFDEKIFLISSEIVEKRTW